jgi:hypothetical protein
MLKPLCAAIIVAAALVLAWYAGRASVRTEQNARPARTRTTDAQRTNDTPLPKHCDYNSRIGHDALVECYRADDTPPLK